MSVIACRRKSPVLEAMQVTDLGEGLDAVAEWAEYVTSPLPPSARAYWHVGDWYVQGPHVHQHLTNDEFERLYCPLVHADKEGE